MVLSLLLTFLSSLFLSASASLWIYFFPVLFAIIILNLEILSLFGLINHSGIIILNLLTLIGAICIWKKTGCKIPPVDLRKFFRKYINCLKLDKSLIILSVCFAFLVVVSFLISLYTPVNEGDAKAYHIFRAIMFSSSQTIAHFDTNEIRNLVMPINSEIIYTWIYTLTKNDIGFGLVSFCAYLFSIGSIWGILGHFSFCMRKKLWVVFVFSSLAGIIAQISSTQSDLMAGSLLLGTIYFYLKNSKVSTFLSALCIALALGTKSTAVMAFLGVFVFIMLYCKNHKRILLFLGLCALNFLIFSSYNYILNFISFGNPLGSQGALASHAFWGGLKGYVANFLRYILQMFDFSGFTWGYFLNENVMHLFNKGLAILNIDTKLGVNMEFEHLNCFLTEQTMGYGILGWLIFLPCALFAPVYAVFKRKSKRALAIGLLGIIFFINISIMSASIAYMVFSIRFISTFIVLSSPVLVFSYFKKMNPFKFIIIFFAAFYMCVASTHLSQRPFFKLQKEFKRLERQEFNQKARCENFSFYRTDTSDCQLFDFIREKYSPNQNIAFILDSASALSVLKFLEKPENGGYRVNFLNAKHLNELDVSKYDTLVINDNGQKISTLFKNDKIDFNYKSIGGDIHFIKKEDPGCIYFDKKFNPVFSKKNVVVANCMISPNYYIDRGFRQIRVFKPKYHDYDKQMVQTFFIFSK